MSLYDGARLRRAREAQGRSQISVGKDLGVSAKTISRIEQNKPGVSWSDVVQYAKLLGVSLSENPIAPSKQADIVALLRMAGWYAMCVGLRVLKRPYRAGNVTTSPTKITDKPLHKDRTEAVDKATFLAIRAVVQAAIDDPNGPFAGIRVVIVDEEHGRIVLNDNVPSTAPTLVIFVDSCDDTSSALRFVGGMVLLSVYLRGHGFLGCVAGDLVRFTLHSRIMGQDSIAMFAERRELDVSDVPTRLTDVESPLGDPYAMTPSKQETLKDASICCYMGKAQRVRQTAIMGEMLWEEETGIREVLSLGGSRGPIYVGESLLDAQSEFVKGFRFLDAIPGIMIADGAGAVVEDLEGNPFHFGRNVDLDAAIDNDFADKSVFERLRVQFTVGSTKAIVNQIRYLLKSD